MTKKITDEGDAKVAKKWISEIATLTTVEIAEEIPYFRIGKTCKSDWKKLQFMVMDKNAMHSFYTRLTVREKATFKPCTPPKTELQRITQNGLERHKNQADGD